MCFLFFVFYFFYFFQRFLFIFGTERDRAWTGEGQRERETQNQKQAPGSEPSAQSPTQGSNSRTARSWPGWSWTLNRLRHPGAPTGVLFWRDTCTPMFIAALSTIAKVWKKPKCPSMDEWIKKMWYIYTMEYYSAIKKNEILPFATMRIELEGIMLSEISQRKTNIMTSFIWGL